MLRKKGDKKIVVIEGNQISPTVCEDVLGGTYDHKSNKCYVAKERIDENKVILEKLDIEIIEGNEE